MGDAGFFKGNFQRAGKLSPTYNDLSIASQLHLQDTRFKEDKEIVFVEVDQLLPKELDQKVDMRKVELSVMRPWITDKIMELLGFGRRSSIRICYWLTSMIP
ncbi:hypothetical protein Pst134EA_031605 [Puccinia striiformis f. sp. tritici]|uniref:uncharacterized protein n=1 Tax=Puccinia striiformis f. sp. tritici TaxID=168172 RepID=UPI00200786A6|nr:uncharacterized protein Pst134EA_031605 [Puccinia striiformis f. sp. tritici]KAH9442728.1 hypothetical protein Pst134EA_031605 [Puccinia striiformis f. sp. tritici]